MAEANNCCVPDCVPDNRPGRKEQRRRVMSDGFLFRSALKDLLRPKKLIAALILALTPCLIALAWRVIVPASEFKPDEAYNRLAEQLVFGFLLVILACVFATSAVSQEIEQKTVVYLLTRPVPRWRILLMKFAATFAVTTVTVWLASLLLALSTHGLSGWSGSGVGRDLLIAPVACLAYGALFLLLATVFSRAFDFRTAVRVRHRVVGSHSARQFQDAVAAVIHPRPGPSYRRPSRYGRRRRWGRQPLFTGPAPRRQPQSASGLGCADRRHPCRFACGLLRLLQPRIRSP